MKIKKKFERGTAHVFVSRKKALQKLQLNLRDFRRLCILKGIYPREPNKVKKANGGGSSEHRIFYHLKDIKFLAQEPLLNKFREHKAFLKKVTRARAKRDHLKLEGLFRAKPTFNFDHLVRERYPTFLSALRDLDDALCLCFAFAALTQSKIARQRTIYQCRRAVTEFMHFIIEAKALRKVFVSIKGVYYQAEIMGERVTWVVGHERAVGRANELDFSVMVSFVDFYLCMLSFVNFRLFKTIGLFHPPQLQRQQMPSDSEFNFTNSNDLDDRVYSLAFPLKRTDKLDDDASIDTFADDDTAEGGESLAEKIRLAEAQKTLFAKCKFFLNREVPKEPLAFVIRSGGGFVCWDGCAPNSVDEHSEQITHQIVDRNVEKANINRVYVQPQWVFDCFNARRILPSVKYAPLATLPPHLSPFVDDEYQQHLCVENGDDYIPLECIERVQQQNGVDVTPFLKGTTSATSSSAKKCGEKKEKGDDAMTKMGVRRSKVLLGESRQKLTNAEGHDLKLREMMVPKKHRRVYAKIKYGMKRKAREAHKLAEKRAKLSAKASHGRNSQNDGTDAVATVA